MKRSVKLATTIYLLSGFALAAGALAGLYLMIELKDTGTAYGSLLRNQVRQADSARLIQVTFKKQVQAWKDTLLRGYDPKNLAKYSEEFHTFAGKVHELAVSLEAELQDADARALTRDFVSSHAALGSKYEAALQVFIQAKGLNAQEVDKIVKGLDRAATDLCDRIVAVLVNSARNAAAARERRLANTIWNTSIGLLAAFLGIGAIMILIVRKMSRTLRQTVVDLNMSAEQVASAASQVASSSQALAQGSSEQAASLE
ncbi:MAG TPA: hypothetical protein VF767_05780, partial [Bryobacteraceae bacterium]